MKKELIARIIGIFFFVLGLIAIANAIYYERPHLLFWFCYLGLLIMGIGFLRKDAALVTSQLNILTIPLLVWTFDFISAILLKDSILGITDYFFTEVSWVVRFVTLQHVFTIPLAFYALSSLKFKRYDAWKLSFFQLTLVFFITRAFTFSETNTNCVYYSCLPLQFPSYYPVAWFVITFLSVMIVNLFIKNVFSRK